MIEFKSGDILKEQAEALVNTVNCVGIMGRGIALQFKNAYPSNFNQYASACKRKEVNPGQMFVVKVSDLINPKYIINFPTKRHWKGKSRIEDIDSGLVSLLTVVKELGIKSVAIPPLGCGLGGLDWEEVRPRIEASFASVTDVRAIVFGPAGAPDARAMQHSKTVPKMTAGRAALVGLMHRYLQGLLDPVVTLLEIHKLMYFMQEAGEPLKLQYEKALYGPYAKNLGNVLNHVEGYYLSGYADGGDAPDKEIELIPGAVEEANRFLEHEPTTVARFRRVADLVEGFETPFGMELLASVYWVVTRESAKSVDEVTAAIYRWNARKRQFSPRQIHLAYKMLQGKDWLD